MELRYCSTRLLSFSLWWIYKFLLIVGWVSIKILLMAEDFISDRSKISGGLKAFGISSVAITYIDMMVLQERYEGTQTHAILRFIFLFWVFMRDYFLHKFLVCHTDQSSTQLLSGFMRKSHFGLVTELKKKFSSKTS
ncbi:hypothetical protein C5167_047874 [Papaver somniferum]|uniref:Uncharacterized protein n=1 Tax=Papaver somniferum TaxID=3469 RepID=A0A4Y7LLL7_PAPSO|nr:hypothetical protein C5167_047874 [Papaver somniferum]